VANDTLSNYFQKKMAKDISGQAVSPYSAPADAGGSAPSGGGPSAPSAPSAPKGSAGGGTGFVSFGQYFGANAPAIQQQAQDVVGKAAAPTVPQGAPGLGTFKTVSFGPMPTAGTMAQRQAAGPSAKDPYAAQIAQTSAQFAALNPVAQSGDMGENVSAFDQLLGGGVTQRAAKQEQQRLGTLRAALESQQNQWTAEQAARKEEQDRQQAANDKTQALDKKAQEIYGNYGDAALNRPWNELSEAEKAPYLYDANVALGY
jgi:hypothetical protein